MMNNDVISQFASAIYELAIEVRKEKEIRQDLVDLAEVFEVEKEFNRIFVSFNVDAKIKKEMINKIFSKKINNYTLNFLLYLIDCNETKNALSIIKKTINYLDDQLDFVNVIVYSAFPIDKKNLDLLAEKIKKKTKKQPILKLVIDKSLIGGIKISYSDILLDNSIKNKLNEIRNNIRKGEE